jgi:ParB family chromosome partitioning protein
MEDTTVVPTPALVQQIPIDQIHPSSHQVRKTFNEASIKALAESIHQEGLMEPIIVRQMGDHYELISGERRLRASKLTGAEVIEAKVINTVSEAEAAAKGLIENLQREDLNPIEEAEGFRLLLDLKDSHWNQDQIAKVVGKDKSYITRSLDLNNLVDSVKDELRRHNFSRNHGVELSRLLSHEAQLQAANVIKAKDLSVQATRKLVDGMLGGGEKAAKSTPPLPPGGSANASVAEKQAADSSTQSFHFSKKGTGVAITAYCPSAGDLDKFLADLRAAYLAWASKAEVTAAPAVMAEPAVTAASIRIPKTPEEEAEMLALATGSTGPGPLYAWIYGENSSTALSIASLTWADANPSDPSEFVKKILAEMRS